PSLRGCWRARSSSGRKTARPRCAPSECGRRRFGKGRWSSWSFSLLGQGGMAARHGLYLAYQMSDGKADAALQSCMFCIARQTFAVTKTTGRSPGEGGIGGMATIAAAPRLYCGKFRVRSPFDLTCPGTTKGFDGTLKEVREGGILRVLFGQRQVRHH